MIMFVLTHADCNYAVNFLFKKWQIFRIRSDLVAVQYRDLLQHPWPTNILCLRISAAKEEFCPLKFLLWKYKQITVCLLNVDWVPSTALRGIQLNLRLHLCPQEAKGILQRQNSCWFVHFITSFCTCFRHSAKFW